MQEYSRLIHEQSPSGALLQTTFLPFGEGADGDRLRGIAFGPDGLLYVAAVRQPGGLSVHAIASGGQIVRTYTAGLSISSHVGQGELAVARDHLYIGGSDSTGSTSATSTRARA